MFQIRHHSRYAGETPADPPAAAWSQLTCHALHAAEFEAELGREGGSHGSHMAATWPSTWPPTWPKHGISCVIAEPLSLKF